MREEKKCSGAKAGLSCAPTDPEFVRGAFLTDYSGVSAQTAAGPPPPAAGRQGACTADSSVGPRLNELRQLVETCGQVWWAEQCSELRRDCDPPAPEGARRRGWPEHHRDGQLGERGGGTGGGGWRTGGAAHAVASDVASAHPGHPLTHFQAMPGGSVLGVPVLPCLPTHDTLSFPPQGQKNVGEIESL